MTEAVSVGDELSALVVHVDRAQLVRYAGASGDFNPIHFNERVATSVGLDNVIAHGMLTMALAGRLITQWVSDPARIIDFGVRFTRPVVVPDPDGVDVVLTGKVAAITDPAHAGVSGDAPGVGGARTARIDITARVADQRVLGRARATVVLD